jgi:hypothetical protein
MSRLAGLPSAGAKVFLSHRGPGGEGRVREANRRTLHAAHLTLPSLRDGSLPLPPGGRRGEGAPPGLRNA